MGYTTGTSHAPAYETERELLMKHTKLAFALRLAGILLALFVCACEDPYPFLYETDEEVKALVMNNDPQYPDLNMAVMADPHYFSPDLVVEGSAFQDYLDHDRKMLLQSPEILDAAVAQMVAAAPDVVLVAGDMTKDGEALSHQETAQRLQPLLQAGIKVYIVPGNHDVLNGESNRYDGDLVERVANVSPEQFESIYASYGYSMPLHEDPDSLSYIVEPVEGLWLFGLDSAKWRENIEDEHPVTGGKFYPETLSWIELMLIQAIEQDKAVMGFFHHGALAHYDGNEDHYPDYLLDDFQYVSEMLAAYGMRFVFTGHFHAQDVVRERWPKSGIPNHFMADIETGSLVTYPVPWRQIQISNQQMNITSQRITSIPSMPDDFETFAIDFVIAGTILLANETLSGYGVPVADQEILSPQIAQAYVTHLQGDEVVPVPIIDTTGISLIGHLVLLVQGSLIEGWYNDLFPVDNEMTLDMTTGQLISP
jgi:3',5'-cyclic AMP phosphodiesterase CpdA